MNPLPGLLRATRVCHDSPPHELPERAAGVHKDPASGGGLAGELSVADGGDDGHDHAERKADDDGGPAG